MITELNLHEIIHNNNPGFEYEVALFYCLLPSEKEQGIVGRAINQREDYEKIHKIIRQTDSNAIMSHLSERNLSLIDCSLETQNDAIGPADIVMTVGNPEGVESKIGLSVKYANTCTLNITGRSFITDAQISDLELRLKEYTLKYVQEMTDNYGSINNWFRKRKPSATTNEYIDLIRDAVIKNWPYIKDKKRLLSQLYHEDSPIEFWVVKYTQDKFCVNCTPFHLGDVDFESITIAKDRTSFIAFYYKGKKIGHMQVKFNNGFIEKCKKKNADMTVEGERISFGKPFTSWNFSVEE